ncbi:hypothetical protein HOE425_240022 [Hoeflea sp. EC-HK425]|nr:hypothetical protein HOE425_240022 [Hoeflea sp. EC-HK425]
MTSVYRLSKLLKHSRHFGIIRVQAWVRDIPKADFSFVICHDQDRSNCCRMRVTGMSHAGFCLPFAEPVFTIAHPKLCD